MVSIIHIHNRLKYSLNTGFLILMASKLSYKINPIIHSILLFSYILFVVHNGSIASISGGSLPKQTCQTIISLHTRFRNLTNTSQHCLVFPALGMYTITSLCYNDIAYGVRRRSEWTYGKVVKESHSIPISLLINLESLLVNWQSYFIKNLTPLIRREWTTA